MEELLSLLKDGNSRTIEELAGELHTTPADILRKLDYLEHMGIIRKVTQTATSCGGNCSGCSGCSGHAHHGDSSPASSGASCAGCMPDAAILNMGQMWEVVNA